MNGVEKITAKIISDAENDARAKLSQAKAECDDIDAHYAARAEALRERMFSDAEREAENTVSRIKSAAAIEKRNIALNLRGELLDEAFSAALAEVRALSDEKYRELLAGLVASSVIKQVGAEEIERRDYGDGELETADSFEVILNKSDMEKHGAQVVSAARAAIAAKCGDGVAAMLKLSDRAAGIDGGVVVGYGDIEINCSLSMLFSRLREDCEGEVNRILFN